MSLICRVECDEVGRGCEPGPKAPTPAEAKAQAARFGWRVRGQFLCPYHRALAEIPDVHLAWDPVTSKPYDKRKGIPGG